MVSVASVCNTPLTLTTDQLGELAGKRCVQHPFERVQADLGEVLGRYATMSQQFPYKQAGAFGRLSEYYGLRAEPIPRDVDLTFAVGSFLVWDEVGGNYRLLHGGLARLPEILDTRGFHASLFLSDAEMLLGRAISPLVDPKTILYMERLEADLGSVDRVTRVATMVAFELHAERMIEALWGSVVRAFPGVEKDSLLYFQAHVGGDDPAEAYHVAMTNRLIALTVLESERDAFLEAFLAAYDRNIAWCSAVAQGD